jgi:hypothetical protein
MNKIFGSFTYSYTIWVAAKAEINTTGCGYMDVGGKTKKDNGTLID